MSGAVNSNVTSSASAQAFLGEQVSRKGLSITNDSTAILYLLLGDGTATTSNYTVQIGPGGYWEMPFHHTGKVNGIWASANGSARMAVYA